MRTIISAAITDIKVTGGANVGTLSLMVSARAAAAVAL